MNLTFRRTDNMSSLSFEDKLEYLRKATNGGRFSLNFRQGLFSSIKPGWEARATIKTSVDGAEVQVEHVGLLPTPTAALDAIIEKVMKVVAGL